MMRLICDTNVFYNLGLGRVRLDDIANGSDEVLCYSPITPFELAGKWSSRTFAARKAAAGAIVSSKARELPDPETFLTRDVFGYRLAETPFSFVEGVKAMAGSSTMRELVSGVSDVPARVIRKVSAPKAYTWRRTTESKWVRDLIAIQTLEIPGFAGWYTADPQNRKNQVPRLRGAAKKAFLEGTTSHEWALTMVVACQARALLGAKRDKSLVPCEATESQALEIPHQPGQLPEYNPTSG